jgi:soluble lytic murein transglycosylase-like protein
VPAPPDSRAHAGLVNLGPPQPDIYRDQFRAAARLTGVEEAWLRAIAHVESGYDPQAVSEKGAQGVMQLMPDTAAAYEVTDPFDPNQSVQAGARHLADLMRRYRRDIAGAEAVDRHRGVPPYAETAAYVEKVMRLYGEYGGKKR